MGTNQETGPVAVEVDGTPESLTVLDYAAGEARIEGRPLLLVRPYPPRASYSPMQPMYLPAHPRELAEADLREAVERVRDRGVQVLTAAPEGSRHDALARAARHASVLIVRRRRARGPHRIVTAQGTLNLAGRTACPLIVVPTGWQAGTAGHSVYVGVDGTALSREAIGFAYLAASRRNGHLVVVHVDASARRDDGDDWAGAGELSVAESLAGYAERYPDVRVTRFVTNQPAAEALAGVSQQGGLLVLGAHAARLPHDPVTRHVLAGAACPVAVVKHHPTAVERTPAGTSVVVPTY